MRKIAALVALLAVSACGGASSKQITNPDGSTGYLLGCKDPGDCYAEAGDVCPGGYRVLQSGTTQTEDKWATATAAIGHGAQNAGAEEPAQAPPAKYVTETRVVVACR